MTVKLFSSAGYVLLAVYRNPKATAIEVAQNVGLTERTVRNAIDQLCKAGLLEKRKKGRRNVYTVKTMRLAGILAALGIGTRL